MVIFRYVINLLLGIDQLLNTILLGHPDETMSSRLGRARKRERYTWVLLLRILVNLLFFFDTEKRGGRRIWHCEKSIMPLEQQNFRQFNYELWSWEKQ